MAKEVGKPKVAAKGAYIRSRRERQRLIIFGERKIDERE